MILRTKMTSETLPKPSQNQLKKRSKKAVDFLSNLGRFWNEFGGPGTLKIELSPARGANFHIFARIGKSVIFIDFSSQKLSQNPSKTFKKPIKKSIEKSVHFLIHFLSIWASKNGPKCFPKPS